MKLTREEMYQSALHDSPEMWKLKAIECLEWLVKCRHVGLVGDCESGLGISVLNTLFTRPEFSETIRTAILEVCKP